jgi:transposase
MRPRGPAKALEDRRLRAMGLLHEGLSMSEVARRVGCYASSVLRWKRAWKKHGSKGLDSLRVPGRPSRLTRQQKRLLVKYLLQGARAHGHQTDLWTTRRITALIRRRFGVRYHSDYVGCLLRALGWRHEKANRENAHIEEERVSRWKNPVWTRVERGPQGWVPVSSHTAY